MKLPLTISLLASSRVNTLERCLDSLKPLLLKVPAELIVVFTGTDERVRETAARYTDQIIPFTWCNDFAAARNVGLMRAKGEWFMYIDDDEWFEDVTEICDFFLSGEYRKYGYAYYLVRNYEAWDGAHYTDSRAFRLAKRTPELQFADAIHEGLAPLEGEGKAFTAYVHHYGYVTDTGKKGVTKSSRNIPLLLEEIERYPGYGKNYLQLIQEYLAVKELDKAEEACRRAREICQEGTGMIFQDRLRVFLLEILYEKGNIRQAITEAEGILENEDPCMMARLILHGFLIALYAREKSYRRILSCGIEFERMLAYLDAGSMTREERGDYLSEDMVKSPGRLYPGRMNCVQACLELGDYEKAEYFLNLLPWEQEYMFWQFYPQLDRWKETYGEGFLRLLAGLPANSPYLLYQRFLLKEDQELFLRCQEEIDHPGLRRQLVQKALEEKRDFSVLLNRMDLDAWKACIEEIVKNTPYEENPGLMEAQSQLFKNHPRQGLWMKKLLLEKDLTRGFFMKKELMEALREYAVCVREFYRCQYQEWMFSPESSRLLPPDCQQALALLGALEEMEQGSMAEAVRLFGAALQIHPGMTGVIREILRLLGNETENPAQTAGAEFAALAVQMKAALEEMMKNGQFREALSVVAQLLPLLPDDMELLRMQQRLLTK